jgi:hypothetical protein
VKSYANEDQLIKAKAQAVRYAQNEGLREVYLVVFSEVHPRDKLTEAFEENIENVTLKGVLINVNFSRGTQEKSKKRKKA